MPTGIGNRKVLTPRSSKNPRRSLPPQAKLIEAASFESFDDQPSSPDIMTTKLMEKVKNNAKNANNKTTSTSNSKGSSFNQRLTAAATAPTTTPSSNSLSANVGRSKLSTEEFNLGDDDRESSELNDKYKKNSGYNVSSSNDKRPNSYNSTSNTSYNSNNSYNNSYNNNNNASNISSNNSYNNSYTSSKSNNYNSNNSRNGVYSKTPMTYSDIGNNSFDRWNSNSGLSVMTSSLGNGGESIELLQEQVNHLRREYEGLKQRFSDLSRLRLSEPEEMLEEHKKLSEFRDQAAEKTIKTLQKENEQLKKQLAAKINEKPVEMIEKVVESKEEDQESENQDQDEDFMLQVEKILKIYSSFSGLKITPSPTNPLTEWHCEFSSRSGRFDFQLIYESDLNRYQYVPIEKEGDEADEGRVKNLPQFLASDILITADQMQIFFWRLLDTLSKKQQQQ